MRKFRSVLPVSLRLGVFLVGVHDLAGAQTWSRSTAPTYSWYGLASSADGTTVLATSGVGQIYISTNGGSAWAETTVSSLNDLNWGISAAMSADGEASTIVSSGGQVLVSTNSGNSWQITGSGKAAACSADGSRMAVAAGSAGLYLSTNSGSTWYRTTAPAAYLAGVACSAAGTKIIATDGGGGLYVSLDSGQTWASNSVPSPSLIASSADGNTLIAAKASPGTGSGEIYISTNSGVTWKPSTTAPNLVWEGIACSADGTRLAAVPYGAPVYTSADSGATWTSNAVPSLQWSTVCSSADGNKLYAAGADSFLTNSGIWVSQTTPVPTLGIAESLGAISISWLIPSMHFVLQQSSGLDVSSWQDVTNQPTINYTNLNYQIRIPRPAGDMFYRLIAR